jgi:RNA polymerase sigma-54 factor
MVDTGLFQIQSQKLAIGPQMQQSLQVLQAATMELRQLVQQEMAVNPVLELEQPDVSLQDTLSDDPDTGEAYEAGSSMDEEWRDYWSQSRVTVVRSEADEEKHRHMMESITVATTLQEHLRDQLRLWPGHSVQTIQLVEFLIGNLDEKGFLQTNLEDLSYSQALPLADLEVAQKVLISFDPVGVGAVDLRQSLLIQMQRQGKEGSLPWKLVESNLEDLASKRYPQLARKLSVSLEQISRASDYIATLDPRPGSKFTEMRNHYVSPDVSIIREGGEWRVQMLADDLPQLRISNTYKDMLSEMRTSDDAREYLREKIRSGKFLIRSIQQRQQTIQKIATQILKYQRDFFDKGPSYLRTLSMSQVALDVGVHETTVSRAISGKYMKTPIGVFEMKYFFTQGVTTASGEDLSNTSVKEAIAEIIGGENLRKPLSDDKITKMLNEKGINVARRTVAKYREALGILPSHLRKSFS